MIMKKILQPFLTGLLLLYSCTLQAQADSTGAICRVGIFAPVYLDSVFNGANYRYKDQMPKIVIPGLEFLEGAQLALDSIKPLNPVKVTLFDYKSAQQTISSLTNNNTFDSLDLIIASAGSNEFKILADIALKKNIPFISATYPNDGGISSNSFVIILNATLNTHCSGIYNFVLKTLPTSKITLFKKQGVVEERIAAQFARLNTANSSKPLLNLPVVLLKDSFNIAAIEAQLDSTRANTIIVGTLDENYGKRLAAYCASLSKKYNITLIGMPNWDGIKDFSKTEFKSFPIYYSTSFYTAETDRWNIIIKNIFKEKTNGNAMDMVFKGFESTYNFLSLFIKDRNNFMSNLNDKSFKIFTEYDIKPVRNNPKSLTPDYFENKKVYIIKKLNGITVKVF